MKYSALILALVSSIALADAPDVKHAKEVCRASAEQQTNTTDAEIIVYMQCMTDWFRANPTIYKGHF
jgi:hypothetical protein